MLKVSWPALMVPPRPSRNAFIEPVHSVLPMDRNATLSPSVAALPPKVMAMEVPAKMMDGESWMSGGEGGGGEGGGGEGGGGEGGGGEVGVVKGAAAVVRGVAAGGDGAAAGGGDGGGGDGGGGRRRRMGRAVEVGASVASVAATAATMAVAVRGTPAAVTAVHTGSGGDWRRCDRRLECIWDGGRPCRCGRLLGWQFL